jgi:hypothetical protein
MTTPRTEAELREIAAVRGYKQGWVWHMLRTSAEGCHFDR